MNFLPQAWLGYRSDTANGGFVVAICPSCPDCAQAVSEARSSQLRIRMVRCSRCTSIAIEKHLGEFKDA